MKRILFFASIFVLFSCSENTTEDVNLDETNISESDEKEIIHSKIKEFSEHVMAGDHEAIGNMYTEDAKIFPSNLDIIEGREAVTDYWYNPSSYTTSYHKVTPEELKIWGDEAYDYGYYEGRSMDSLGNESPWKGKYVIIWKKEDNDWKVHLDIWNRIAD